MLSVNSGARPTVMIPDIGSPGVLAGSADSTTDGTVNWPALAFSAHRNAAPTNDLLVRSGRKDAPPITMYSLAASPPVHRKVTSVERLIPAAEMASKLVQLSGVGEAGTVTVVLNLSTSDPPAPLSTVNVPGSKKGNDEPTPPAVPGGIMKPSALVAS